MSGERIQDRFLAFCAERALEAHRRGDFHVSREWWEGIGLQQKSHFVIVNMVGNAMPAWLDRYAANSLSLTWVVNTKMLEGEVEETPESRVAREIKAWIERECPAAAEEGAAIIRERDAEEVPRTVFGSSKMREA